MSDVACLVASTDSFFDCWPATLACLERFWPDRPWPIYTTSNTMPWGERPILTGGLDAGWVANLSNALDHLSEPFVLLWLEDVLLCRPVKTDVCRIAEEILRREYEVGAIRLGQGNETKEKISDFHEDSIGMQRVVPDSEYRISTSPTLWRVSYLRKILSCCGITAWDFEIKGTVASRELPDEIWVQSGEGDVSRAFRCYYTGILRGKWVGECLEWLESIGIKVEDTSRGIGWLKDGFYHLNK